MWGGGRTLVVSELEDTVKQPGNEKYTLQIN